MNAYRNAPKRPSAPALAMAVTMTLALLSSMGLLADRYHADERLAQDAAPAAQKIGSAASAARS
jgi:hypothetical protein